MNPYNDGTAEGVQVATMLIVMLLILGVMLYHSPAEGQATYQGATVRRGDDVTLAILCAGERSPLHLDTCTAMVNVVARTAARRGISLGAQARAYSAVFKGTSRPWLRELNARGTRPPSWPRASWTRYRPAWMAVLAHVRAVLAGNVPPVCDEDARHFGNSRDGRRMGAFVRMCEHVDDAQHFWGKQLRDAAADKAPNHGPPHRGELTAPRTAKGQRAAVGSIGQIARDHAVSRKLVRLIRARKIWRHVP